MSKQANPALIGTFVIGAIILVITAILVVGNIRLNRESYRCVLYFNGSLHGLDVGAPVTYRGVSIGKVGAIEITFDHKDNNYHIPVYVDINGDGARLQDNYREAGFENPEEFFESLVHSGLQAKLKMNSLVTGKLYIEFTFGPKPPKTPIIRRNGYLQIPTAPSGLEQFTQAMESLPIQKLVDKTLSALNGIDTLVNDPDLRNGIASLNNAMTHIDALIARADKRLTTLTPKINQLLEDFSAAAVTTRETLNQTRDDLHPAIKDMRATLSRVSVAADSLISTLDNVNTITDENTELPYQLTLTLTEVRKAARSIGDFADYLQRHPNSLLVGPEEENK